MISQLQQKIKMKKKKIKLLSKILTRKLIQLQTSAACKSKQKKNVKRVMTTKLLKIKL